MGKWFANRGQVVQVLLAAVSATAAAVSLYFVLKSNSSLPGTRVVLYVSLGILLLIIGFSIGRKSVGTGNTPEQVAHPPEPIEHVSESATARTELGGTGNSSATATGATASVNQYFIPYAPQPQRESVPPPAKRTANIRCVDVRLTNLRFDVTRHREPLFQESSQETETKVAVATFRNDAEHGKDFSDAENVTAHLRLRDSAGSEIGTGISRACWLDTTVDMVDIPVAETQTVVLFVYEGEYKASIPYQRRVSSGLGTDEIVHDFVEIDLSKLAIVEIELLSYRASLLPRVSVEIRTVVSNGRLQVEVKGPSLRT